MPIFAAVSCLYSFSLNFSLPFFMEFEVWIAVFLTTKRGLFVFGLPVHWAAFNTSFIELWSSLALSVSLACFAHYRGRMRWGSASYSSQRKERYILQQACCCCPSDLSLFSQLWCWRVWILLARPCVISAWCQVSWPALPVSEFDRSAEFRILASPRLV